MAKQTENIFAVSFLNNSCFLLTVIFLVRTLTVLSLGCMPPMESYYFFMAEKFFTTDEKILISFAPGYSAFLYLINLLFNNREITSYFIFISSSTLFAFVLYKWAIEKYSKQTGIIVLWLLVFLPNAAIAYPGYSHCVVAALFFFTLTAYRFWKLWRNDIVANHIKFILPAVCAIALRPEMILLIGLFILCFYFFRIFKIYGLSSSKPAWHWLIMPIVLFTFLCVHKSFVQSRNINAGTTTFSDAFYSYKSFLSVYCIKEGTIFTDSLSVAFSTPHFGTPAENNKSIFQAIIKNPLEVIKNVAYNFTQALKNLPHPLVIPFYFFAFAGFGIFYQNKNPLSLFNLYLLSFAVVTVATLLFFIVQVKYLSVVTIPIVMLSAYGISKLENEKTKKMSVLFLTGSFFIISLIYYVSFLQEGARG
jgi:hypothetical protein